MVNMVKRQVENINIPLLMVHGEADRLNSVVGARKFFDQIRVQDKEFISYPDAYHELHNDLGLPITHKSKTNRSYHASDCFY